MRYFVRRILFFLLTLWAAITLNFIIPRLQPGDPAEAIARKAHAQALVTGEVIGQVSSQTLENMTTIGAVATLPVFRPLIGMDKDEIVAQAQRLGTYSISIIEDQDCCQLFTPKHPATKARPADIDQAERALPIDDFVRQAVEGAVIEDFNYPVIKYPVSQDRSQQVT